ncbi:MAG: tetratricopeptide repeat protein [Bacteroidota bacterium]
MSHEFYFEEARKYLIQEEWQRAKQAIEQALRQKPEHLPYLNLKADILTAMHQFDASLDCLSRLIDLSGTQAASYLHRGRNFCQLDRYEEALADFEKAIELAPSSAEGYHMRACVLGDMGRYQEALEAFDQTLLYAPNHSLSFLYRAEALIHLGRNREALQDLKQAEGLGASPSEISHFRADILLRQHAPDEALTELHAGLESGSWPMKTWLLLGQIYLAQCNWKEALKASAEALGFIPRNRDAIILRTNVLHQIGQPELALKLMEEMLLEQPGDPYLYTQKGLLLVASYEYEAALGAFDQARTIAPRHIAAYLHAGATLEDLGRMKEAKTLYYKGLSIAPDNAKLHNYLGSVLDITGESQQAINWYEKAIDLEPYYTAPHFNLGNAWAALDAYEKALDAYEMVLAIQPWDAEAQQKVIWVKEQMTTKG